MATELKGRKVKELIGPVTIKNRIRKNQKKSFWIGVFYWVATLVLFVLSVFPMVGEFSGYSTDEHVWVVTFIEPLMAFISGLSNLSRMTKETFNNGVVSIFYALLLLTSLFCFVGSTLKLFKIRKKNPTTKWGYNRATAAMKSMGRHYGTLLSAIVANAVTNLFFGDGNFTLFFYITLGFGIFFHLVLNLASATISYFQSSEDRFKPIEQKRQLGYFMYFIRNVLQIGLVFLFVLLLDKFGGVLDAPYYLVSGAVPTDGRTVLLLLLLLVLWLCVCALIRYVFSSVSYNEYGLKLRRPFPAFLFIRRWVFWFSYKDVNALGIFLGINTIVAIVGQILVMTSELAPKWVLLAVAAILLQWIFADIMFKVLERNKIRKDKKKRLDCLDPKADRDDFNQFIDEEFKLIQEKVFYRSQGLPAAPKSSIVSVGDTSEPAPKVKEKKKKEEVVASVVPMETPLPVVEETTAETVAEPEEVLAPVEAYNYDDGLTDEERARRKAIKEKWIGMAAMDVDFDEETEESPFLEEQIVDCPGCGKKLSVKFGTDVAKCPACEAMFVLKKLVKDESDGSSGETLAEETSMEAEDEAFLLEAEEEVRKMMEEA